MWRRTFRLSFWLFFVWIAVLGWRQGTWSWVIVPLFGFGCLFIAKDYITRRYPDFGGKLTLALFGLMLSYNIVFTVWPLFVREMPWTATVLDNWKKRGDFDTAISQLDAAPLKAQEVLERYRIATNNAEAAALEQGLDALLARRRAGNFNEDDQREQQQLLDRYQTLVRESAAIRQIVTDVNGVTPRSSSAAPAMTSTVPSTPVTVQSSRNRGNQPAPSTGPAVSQIPAPSRAQTLDAFVNSLAPSTQNRIAAIFRSGSDRPLARSMYSALRTHDKRLVSDLFQEPAFSVQGFFAEIESGNTATLIQTRAVNLVSYFLVARIADQCKSSSDADPRVGTGVLTCTVDVTAKLFNRQGQLVEAENFVGTGVGFSENVALNAAVDKGAIALADALLKPLN
jgi:hypothetical protein